MAKRTPRPSADTPAADPPEPVRARKRAAPRRKPVAAGSEQAPMDVSSPANRSDSMGSEPSEDDIRLRAYHRYLERGGGHGLDFDDWLEAERELKTRRG